MSNSPPNNIKEPKTTDQLIIVILKERLPTDQYRSINHYVKTPYHSVYQPH